MTWKSITTIAAILLVALSACNLPLGPVTGNGQDPNAAAQIQVAAIVASTDAAQT